jgi:mycothiol synthase
VAQARGLPPLLRIGCRDHERDRILFLEQQGFRHDRTFLEMVRSLSELLPTALLPEGFKIVHSLGQADLGSRVDLYRTDLTSQEGAASRFNISLTKQRLIFVVA